jgi:mRNA-degrading endonuclease RelE of RelBE toxin-antitoxin system
MARLEHVNRPAHLEVKRLVSEIKADPHGLGYLLMHGRWKGTRAVQFGRNNYRLLWDVTENPKRVIFRTVGHRQSVYREDESE